MSNLNRIIKTNLGVAELRQWLKGKDIVSVDTETTGVISSSEIIGYSIAARLPDDTIQSWYVITAFWDVPTKTLKYLETKDTAPDVMRDLIGKRLVLHNAVFDCQMIERNYGVSLISSVFCDTMIMASLVDENRRVGLKELAEDAYGESARDEQAAMRASVSANGGVLTKKCYELYKGSCDLIAEYGNQDTVLTLRLFYDLLPLLEEEGMTEFFFDDESMPLLRGPTYHLNSTGLKVDLDKLAKLKKELEIESAQLTAFIDSEITPHIKDKYPAKSKKTTFNIDSREQLAWLLFDKLGNTFVKVSNSGADLCKAFESGRPYTGKAKKQFIQDCKDNKGRIWRKKGTWDPKKKKKMGEAKVKDYFVYLSTDKHVLATFAKKYKWVEKLLELRKCDKMLGTYVGPWQERHEYGILHPQFLQAGTTSGRFSSKQPNFQQIPRDDKRLKSCIISRPGKVFVASDQAQLEPRIFASYSQDETLMASFKKGEDFYSVVGAPIFNKTDCSLFKNDPNSFAKLHPSLRDKSKVIALATPYGRTAAQQASTMGIEVAESQALIDKYFATYPKVELMMLNFHEQVKKNGYVQSRFGRKRRIPEAMRINKIYGNKPHAELPYAARTLLNLAMNHPVQADGASIMNRSAIRFLQLCEEVGIKDVRLVVNIHDELVAECNEADAEDVAALMKEAMENTVSLPGVDLVAEPKIGRSLAEVK